MTRILSLALALVLAFSINANADNHEPQVSNKKALKEQMRDKPKGEMHKKARKACAEKCNVNKEKVKACRKSHGAEKGQSLKGKCMPEKTKSCMKKCMGKKKDKQKNRREERKQEVAE